MPEAVLTFWTIYDHPKDYPNQFIARASYLNRAGKLVITQSIILGETLEEVREQVQKQDPFLTRMARDKNDDPVIVEVWL